MPSDKTGSDVRELQPGPGLDREETREVVRETLRQLGIDPDDYRGHQSDMAFVRRQREGAEQISRWSKRTAVGVFVSGIVWLIIEGIQAALRARGM